MLSQVEFQESWEILSRVLSAYHQINHSIEPSMEECARLECILAMKHLYRIRSLERHLPKTTLDAELDEAMQQFGLKLRQRQEALGREFEEAAYDTLDVLLAEEKKGKEPK